LIGLIKVDEVNEVNSTFRDGTTEVSRKRVVYVIDADLRCSINCRSLEGLLILKVLQRFPNKNL
jgi:hypothetical protein